MSQKFVCRRARPLLSPAGLHRIEEGERKDPRLATLWALAAALNLRVTITAEGVEIEWLKGHPPD
jgi:transcriptional regulator with XRE-family HTH domain